MLLIIFGILLMLYGANSLTPAICAAMDQAESGHARSGNCDAVRPASTSWCSWSGFRLLIAFVMRPAPKTSGIIEMTPQECACYDQALNRVIENVEARYGLRPPARPGSRRDCGPRPVDRCRDGARDRIVLRQEAASRPGARAGKSPPAGGGRLDRHTLAE